MSNTAIDLKNHFCLQQAEQLKKINSPLNLLGIDAFCFTSVDLHTSERYILTDHPHWTHFAYKSEFYGNEIVKKIEMDNIINSFLWSDFAHNFGFNAILQEAKAHGLKHGITFIQYTEDRANMYYAGTSNELENDRILLDIKDQLMDFIPYFHYAAKDIIAESSKHTFTVRKNQATDIEKAIHEKLKLFYDAISVKQIVINEQGDYLTHQEAMCVYLSLCGKTARIIASTLNISARTVETHLLHARKKMRIESDESLLGKLFSTVYFNHIMLYGKRHMAQSDCLL